MTVAYPPEYLAAMETSGIPLSELKLKVNAPVVVLRNLDPSNGVCNGTREVIVRMSQRILQVRLLSGEHAGEEVLIPRTDRSHNQ